MGSPFACIAREHAHVKRKVLNIFPLNNKSLKFPFCVLVYRRRYSNLVNGSRRPRFINKSGNVR